MHASDTALDPPGRGKGSIDGESPSGDYTRERAALLVQADETTGRAYLDQLRENKPERLVWVQHALIDLIDLLDPEYDRFAQNRNRLPAPYSR